MEYPYRPESNFVWLTGWGADTVPGSVLVFAPADHGHDITLYIHEPAGRDVDEFYTDPHVGEFWIGPRPSAEEVQEDLGIAVRGRQDLSRALAQIEAGVNVLFASDAEPGLLAFVPSWFDRSAQQEALLAQNLSEARLIKDEYEIQQLRAAIAATARGFDDVFTRLDSVRDHARGERLAEVIFTARARVDGNGVGYGTISAAGPHACFLHWTQNDGEARDGDLLLLDAGVEVESLYTADITRTFPVSGRYTATQREVYDAVLKAADEGLKIARPGVRLRDIHDRVMRELALKLRSWGILAVPVEEALRPENQQHRRYMFHGTSHHLGLDVHDCAHARREAYVDGILSPGMIFTVEPGLYFRADDLTVPEEFRGIGIRIEDDVLVTAEGVDNLSAAIPRTPDEIERRLS